MNVTLGEFTVPEILRRGGDELTPVIHDNAEI
jgi:hypothetical protein